MCLVHFKGFSLTQSTGLPVPSASRSWTLPQRQLGRSGGFLPSVLVKTEYVIGSAEINIPCRGHAVDLMTKRIVDSVLIIRGD